MEVIEAAKKGNGTDLWMQRMVLVVLCIVFIGCLAWLAYCSYSGKESPSEVSYLVASIGGALLTYLTTTVFGITK